MSMWSIFYTYIFFFLYEKGYGLLICKPLTKRVREEKQKQSNYWKNFECLLHKEIEKLGFSPFIFFFTHCYQTQADTAGSREIQISSTKPDLTTCNSKLNKKT